MSSELAQPGKTALGWIGSGVMGASMCGHLLSAGYSITVYSRTKEKARGLIERGATWADSPRQVAEQSSIVFSIVGFPSDVREVHLGSQGILAGAKPGSIAVDMTTSQPSLAGKIASAAEARGVQALDAPVSGGDIGAREARLSIMVGGSAEAFQRVLPCFERLGKTIVFQGGPGAGQHAKMVNQVLIASNMVGVCEALLYAYRSGLDLPRVLESISSGAAGSWSLSNLAPRIVQNRFDPGFYVEHFLKDMGIALEESRRMGIALPGLALAEQLYRSVQALGHGRDGTQALMLALAAMSGIDWPAR